MGGSTSSDRCLGYEWYARVGEDAGVDLLTIKELGGWRTLAMVQRYAHLKAEHLHRAVDGSWPRGLPSNRSQPRQKCPVTVPSRQGTRVLDALVYRNCRF